MSASSEYVDTTLIRQDSSLIQTDTLIQNMDNQANDLDYLLVGGTFGLPGFLNVVLGYQFDYFIMRLAAGGIPYGSDFIFGAQVDLIGLIYQDKE